MTSSPLNTPDPDTNTTQHQSQPPQQLQEPDANPNPNPIPDPPQTLNHNSSKTLTLEMPSPEPDMEGQTPLEDDQNPDDIDEVPPFSPTAISSVRGGGPRRKKLGRRGSALGKRSLKKLECLAGTLNPLPFKPNKTLDFSSHEILLKRLGLWDFVHLQFDSNLRSDLIAQLIANYNSSNRCSYVNDSRIKVNRADLARALKLPVKKEKASATENDSEVKESEESIGFIDELVSNWILLHEDTWIMPSEIVNWTKAIKEGSFEKVDWAGMIWSMLDKELAAGASLTDCYYASHLQCLIRSQREELFKLDGCGREEEVDLDAEADEEEDQGKTNDEPQDQVRTNDEHRENENLAMEEHKIELHLGGVDKAADESEKADKEVLESKESVQCNDDDKQEELGQGLKNSMNGPFLQRCNLSEVVFMDCEEERKPEVVMAEDEIEDGEHGEEVEEEDEDDDEEEEGQEDMAFGLSPKGDTMEGVSSENLIDAMEAQIPFSSGMHYHDNLSSGDFLVSNVGVDAQGIQGSSSVFGNGNSYKREIGQLDNDEVNVGNKRMRGNGSWQMKSGSEFDMCMDQMLHFAEKAKRMYEAKEQNCHEMIMQQQMLLGEHDRQENLIQHLQKLKYDEERRRHFEVGRLENEIYLMGKVLEGYRKALRETQKAFADYRAKYPQPEEPTYKDAGPGGLVLSTMELERQRLKKEEEERLLRLLIEKKAEEVFANGNSLLEAHTSRLDVMNRKLLDIEKEVSLLKEISTKRKALKQTESAPMEE